ncbi:hypothetical protein AKO1_003170 [Acrasis kona]|uniref:Integrase catalytic domain-containing protein n=1 Tax=Acrasis kona TaxID=1008807 RepID=A0AAW2Z9V2_9EUKA
MHHLQVDYTFYSDYKILNYVDHFTKRVWSFSTPTKEGKHVIKALELIKAEVGIYPTIFHSDNGGEFVNDGLSEFCILHNIEERHGQAYNPQCQGAIEAANKTIKIVIDNIRLGQDTSKLPFHAQLEMANLAYNGRIHTTTKVTPFEALNTCIFINPKLKAQATEEQLQKATSMHLLIRNNTAKRNALDLKKSGNKQMRRNITIRTGDYVWYTEGLKHKKKKLVGQQKKDKQHYGLVVARSDNNRCLVTWLLTNGGPKGEKMDVNPNSLESASRNWYKVSHLYKCPLKRVPVDGKLSEEVIVPESEAEEEEEVEGEDEDEEQEQEQEEPATFNLANTRELNSAVQNMDLEQLSALVTAAFEKIQSLQQLHVPQTAPEPTPKPIMETEPYKSTTTIKKRRKRKEHSDAPAPTKRRVDGILDLETENRQEDISPEFRVIVPTIQFAKPGDKVIIKKNDIEIGRGEVYDLQEWHQTKLPITHLMVGITETTQIKTLIPLKEPGQKKRTLWNDFLVGDFVGWCREWLEVVQ